MRFLPGLGLKGIPGSWAWPMEVLRVVGVPSTQVEEARADRSPVPASHRWADLASPLSQSPPPEHISCMQDKPY